MTHCWRHAVSLDPVACRRHTGVRQLYDWKPQSAPCATRGKKNLQNFLGFRLKIPRIALDGRVYSYILYFFFVWQKEKSFFFQFHSEATTNEKYVDLKIGSSLHVNNHYDNKKKNKSGPRSEPFFRHQHTGLVERRPTHKWSFGKMRGEGCVGVSTAASCRWGRRNWNAMSSSTLHYMCATGGSQPQNNKR